MFRKKKENVSVGNLIDGLPIPQNTVVLSKLLPDKLEMKALIGTKKEDWKTFELPLEKIDSMQIVNEKEIQKIVSQSAPGMIIGAAAFGILGAMVGGRVKTKEKVKISTLLLIDYTSEEKKQILLNVTSSVNESSKLVKEFKVIKPTSNDPITL